MAEISREIMGQTAHFLLPRWTAVPQHLIVTCMPRYEVNLTSPPTISKWFPLPGWSRLIQRSACFVERLPWPPLIQCYLLFGYGSPNFQLSTCFKTWSAGPPKSFYLCSVCRTYILSADVPYFCSPSARISPWWSAFALLGKLCHQWIPLRHLHLWDRKGTIDKEGHPHHISKRPYCCPSPTMRNIATVLWA